MSELQISVTSDEIDDPEIIDSQVSQLRDELLELDVDGVYAAKARGELTPGTKSATAMTVGEIIVQLATSAVLLENVVQVVQAWVQRNVGNKVIIKKGKDELEMSGMSSRDQREVVSEWIKRNR